MKQAIHISDLKSFIECRRKWDWSSLMRQGLERVAPYAPFFTGRAVHWCLQQYYETQLSPSGVLDRFIDKETEAMKEAGELWSKEQEVVDEQIELLRGMLAHYELWAPRQKGHFADENLNFISLETEFSVPLRNPITKRASPKVFLEGRFDGLVQRKDNGSFWLWETKTARSIDVLAESLFNDFQAGAYLIAAQELFGVQVSGVLYNILRKKIPTRPRVLQSGMLSVAQNIDTTAEVYMQAIRENHPEWFPPEDAPLGSVPDSDSIMAAYGDTLQRLMNEGKPYFARLPVRRTQTELGNLADEIHYIALQMANPKSRITANGAALFNVCTRCQFRAPCLAMNAGADYEYILGSEYRPRRRWDSLMAMEGDTSEANGSYEHQAA